MCFSEKMCVRNVIVLVFLCCVNSRAQWDPNSSQGFQKIPEKPGLPPYGTAPQFGTNARLSDNSANLDPQGPFQYGPSPELSQIPENSNMNTQYGPPSGNLNIQDHIQYGPSPEMYNLRDHPDMHMPNDPPPVILEIPYHPDMNPQDGLYPGIPDFQDHTQYQSLENSDIHNHHMHPQYGQPHGIPDILDLQHSPPHGFPDHRQHGPHFGHPGLPDHPQHGPPHGDSDFLDHSYMHPHKMPPPHQPILDYADDPKPPDLHPRLVYAGLPRKLEVFPLPLEDSDHELQFNVSWVPTLGGKATEYSLEVRSVTDTVDCKSLMCYDPFIPGNLTWSLIPKAANLVADTCAVRPGCAYMVKLTSHPWDGHTSANIHLELDECVAGVCSCAHSPRLPAPIVSAPTVIIKGEMYANVTWTLPTPSYPQRLPSARLGKQSYIVSLGKQMISDAHVMAPWFSIIKSRQVHAEGLVSKGDTTRSLLLPLSERGVPIVNILARVNLVDDRGCVGPAGNATAFNPETPTKSKFSFGVYAILGALIGAWAMGAVFVLSARVVKRVLKSFRPAPVSAPLEPLRRRPAWFPLQLRT